MENSERLQAEERRICGDDAPSKAPTVLMKPVVLASASPRRAEILRLVGWPFVVDAANVDESAEAGESPPAYVERLALAKAEAVAKRRLGESNFVLGADTVVVVDDEVLGKPRDEADAGRMLRLLRGRWHQVLTGVALVRAGAAEARAEARAEAGAEARAEAGAEAGEPQAATAGRIVAHERTSVQFSEMTDEEIDWYVATGEPLDKAGAYAVQNRAALFIKAIEGDYWNVVGLPVQLIYKLAPQL